MTEKTHGDERLEENNDQDSRYWAVAIVTILFLGSLWWSNSAGFDRGVRSGQEVTARLIVDDILKDEASDRSHCIDYNKHHDPIEECEAKTLQDNSQQSAKDSDIAYGYAERATRGY